MRPNYALEIFAVLGENINNLVLTYTLGICVFPACSGFVPGWVYVHVGGGATYLSVPYWALVLLEFVVCCTVLVDLTVRTLYHCVGNVICYCGYHYLFIEETKVCYCHIFTGIMAAHRLPNLVCICLTDGPRMHPVVYWHYTTAVYCFSAVCSCFLLCTVIVHCKTFVTLFIEILVYL